MNLVDNIFFLLLNKARRCEMRVLEWFQNNAGGFAKGAALATLLNACTKPVEPVKDDKNTPVVVEPPKPTITKVGRHVVDDHANLELLVDVYKLPNGERVIGFHNVAQQPGGNNITAPGSGNTTKVDILASPETNNDIANAKVLTNENNIVAYPLAGGEVRVLLISLDGQGLLKPPLYDPKQRADTLEYFANLRENKGQVIVKTTASDIEYGRITKNNLGVILKNTRDNAKLVPSERYLPQ